MLSLLRMKGVSGLSYNTHVPVELLTGTGLSPKPRVRVDAAQTSFFEGREFRMFYEFNIAQGATAVLRFTSPVDFVLFEQRISIDAGSLRMSAVSAGGTAGGTFNALSVIGKNRMLSTPAYTAQMAVAQGGTHTGGTEVEVVRVVSNQQGNSASTVGSAVNDERGLPPGTYYIRLQNIGTGACTGVYSAWWEERAAQADLNV